eukprot:553541_1
MEQAVLLANEIYNRERTRHEAEMAEKDVEILKLRKFLLSFTNRHAKSQKSLITHNGGHQQRKINKNGISSLRTPTDLNAPGARKSKIVKPKVIKAGGLKTRNFNNNNHKIKRIKINNNNNEHKSDD